MKKVADGPRIAAGFLLFDKYFTNINKISVKQGVICNALSYNEVTTAEFFAPRHGIRTEH